MAKPALAPAPRPGTRPARGKAGAATEMSDDDANRDPTGGDAVLDRMLAQGERLVRELGPILPLDLTFGFEGRDFKARFEAAGGAPGEEEAVLLLEAHLGRVPYSAEDAAARARLLARVAAFEGPQAPGRFLVHRGRLKLLGRTRLPMPADGFSLIAALAICVLEARSFLSEFAAGDEIPATRRFSAERRA